MSPHRRGDRTEDETENKAKGREPIGVIAILGPGRLRRSTFSPRIWNSPPTRWVGGFSDYTPGVGTGYDLSFGWSALPAEVGPGGGLRISSNNHSDDLFSYVKREITGLVPGKTYVVDFETTIDTNAPASCGGIGGAPGSNVAFT